MSIELVSYNGHVKVSSPRQQPDSEGPSRPGPGVDAGPGGLSGPGPGAGAGPGWPPWGCASSPETISDGDIPTAGIPTDGPLIDASLWTVSPDRMSTTGTATDSPPEELASSQLSVTEDSPADGTVADADDEISTDAAPFAGSPSWDTETEGTPTAGDPSWDIETEGASTAGSPPWDIATDGTSAAGTPPWDIGTEGTTTPGAPALENSKDGAPPAESPLADIAREASPIGGACISTV